MVEGNCISSTRTEARVDLPLPQFHQCCWESPRRCSKSYTGLSGPSGCVAQFDGEDMSQCALRARTCSLEKVMQAERNGAYRQPTNMQKGLRPARLAGAYSRRFLVSLDRLGCGVGCGITSLAKVYTTIICNPNYVLPRNGVVQDQIARRGKRRTARRRGSPLR